MHLQCPGEEVWILDESEAPVAVLHLSLVPRHAVRELDLKRRLNVVQADWLLVSRRHVDINDLKQEQRFFFSFKLVLSVGL